MDKIKNKLSFFKTGLKDGNIGAVFRSSVFVVRRILKELDLKKAVILEYGPGDGVMTKKILKKMGEKGRIYAIETNKDFAKKLEQIGDPRLSVFNQDVEKFLEENEGLKADYVISGIPFSFLDEEKREKIVKETFNILKENGEFVAYQNSNLILPTLKKYFPEVKSSFEPRNIMPYFIMKAKK